MTFPKFFSEDSICKNCASSEVHHFNIPHIDTPRQPLFKLEEEEDIWISIYCGHYRQHVFYGEYKIDCPRHETETERKARLMANE